MNANMGNVQLFVISLATGNLVLNHASWNLSVDINVLDFVEKIALKYVEYVIQITKPFNYFSEPRTIHTLVS